MKKKLFFIFALIALVAGVYFISTGREKSFNKPVAANVVSNVPANRVVLPSSQPEVQKPAAIRTASQSPEKSSGNISQVSAIGITFSDGTESYSVDVKDGSTVYDAMLTLASTTSFSFKSQYYSGLGYFIKEINGKPNGNGAYWTLYVNGKYSNVGASQYKLQPSDSVEWKYEKQ